MIFSSIVLTIKHKCFISAQTIFTAFNCPPSRIRSHINFLTEILRDPASRCSPFASLKLAQRSGLRVLTIKHKCFISAQTIFTAFNCPPSRIRTYDRSLKRRLLYRLSYGRFISMCSERESNPHPVRDTILSRARIPIPPSELYLILF